MAQSEAMRAQPVHQMQMIIEEREQKHEESEYVTAAKKEELKAEQQSNSSEVKLKPKLSLEINVGSRSCSSAFSSKSVDAAT